MLDTFVARENVIFETLQKFIDARLDFIVIGGYGVSSYKHRFSVDADIVVREEGAPSFESILRKNKFKRTISKKLDASYAPFFMRYELKRELPISIDILLNAVAVRQTGASFSFDIISKYSSLRKITGIQKEIIANVPSREILITLKIHSGRLTDLRDVVALCKDVDFGLIKELVHRGDFEVVRAHVKELLKLVNEHGFVDSFKGVFVEKKYDVDWDAVRKLALITTQ